MATYTMQELELETAELLPARETLWCRPYGGYSSSSFSQGGVRDRQHEPGGVRRQRERQRASSTSSTATPSTSTSCNRPTFPKYGLRYA